MAPRVKRRRSATPDLEVVSANIVLKKSSTSTSDSPHKSKKLKILSTYSSDSPFPDFGHPTHAEATEVHAILAKEHPAHARKRQAPLDTNNSAQTCGKVPNVIESLIGTILSQNTSARNSTAAKQSLDDAFGRDDFTALAGAPRAAVVEALRHGGLANKKAATIQNLLSAVKARHGTYSLQHLAAPGVTDDEVMRELVSYDGVGPKTASCVLLFCLGRDSFAVDTHVFRLSKLLGWVPARADRVLAQAHLDLRIPDELKYTLHVLMVHHGRSCSGCKNSGKGSCPLKTYLRERKGVKAEDLEDKVVEVNRETGEGSADRHTLKAAKEIDVVDTRKVFAKDTEVTTDVKTEQ